MNSSEKSQRIKVLLKRYGISYSEIGRHMSKRFEDGCLSRRHVHDILADDGKSIFENYEEQFVRALNSVFKVRGIELSMTREQIFKEAA